MNAADWLNLIILTLKIVDLALAIYQRNRGRRSKSG